jgi:hypothetical protein
VVIAAITVYHTNLSIAFEGSAHPYKKNLVQYPEQDVRSLVQELPDISKMEWKGEVKI